ncbi:unnamed protein product [Urochloa humidicola]
MESGEGGGCRLPEELEVEILRRLPYRSFCRARCVSRSWRDLSCHPDHRGKLAQDLAGLLYTNYTPSHLHGDFAVRFAPAGSSPFPGLGFLPCGARALPIDCCNGLVLCRGGGCQTSAIRLLEDSPRCRTPRLDSRRLPWLPSSPTAPRLDSMCSTLQEQSLCKVSYLMKISKNPMPMLSLTPMVMPTAAVIFVRRVASFVSKALMYSRQRPASGWRATSAVSPVLEGRACRLISLPVSSWFGLVGCLRQSQGFLQYAVQEDYTCTMMQVWTLKDFEEGEWVLKHRFEIEVAPQTKILFDYAAYQLQGRGCVLLAW